jgi:hypothetical protein
MPRMIKMDCPECKAPESLTVAFGDPYKNFGDNADDDDFRAELRMQTCTCDLEDDERIEETVRQWNADCYPYQIQGEWYEYGQ